jgi:hypothetical protein
MKPRSSLLAGAALALGLSLGAAGAQAAVTVIPQSALVASTGYYTNDLGVISVTTGGGSSSNVGDPSGRNDDGWNGPVSLGFNFTMFGVTYNSLYINNNGNVSFGNGISAFVPSGPTGASQPIISPWFDDVDTRGALSGVVHLQENTPGQLVVTWDNVGYYNSGDNLLDSFQLVLRSDSFNVPVGEGQIGFFYGNMGWEQTGTSQVAAIGFGDGAGNGEVLDGSSNQTNLNTIVANHHIWFNQNLSVVPAGVPEPNAWAMMILGFLGLGVALRSRRRSDKAMDSLTA